MRHSARQYATASDLVGPPTTGPRPLLLRTVVAGGLTALAVAAAAVVPGVTSDVVPVTAEASSAQG